MDGIPRSVAAGRNAQEMMAAAAEMRAVQEKRKLHEAEWSTSDTASHPAPKRGEIAMHISRMEDISGMEVELFTSVGDQHGHPQSSSHSQPSASQTADEPRPKVRSGEGTLVPTPAARHACLLLVGHSLRHGAPAALLVMESRRRQQWMVPGGYIDRGDKDAAHAAFREHAEEVLGLHKREASARARQLLALARRPPSVLRGPFVSNDGSHHAFVALADRLCQRGIDGALCGFVQNRECAAAALIPLAHVDGRQRAVACFGDGPSALPLRNGLGARRVASALDLIRQTLREDVGSWGPGRALGSAADGDAAHRVIGRNA
mmetsp:Transcript_26366/g.61506  ORF Transcript_26366/g.61506 Transcript_26366/m.61506 type:complete len:319 (-) Transcript_26366:116-1072(-)